ncbi:MAG: tRNA (adenosine(37)-N6)-dimethylallyltransferase MiaA [Bacteroidaceae bacterium]|nr:tRNA (adenosine(37)-N6)-dimethylallyltransferase MiaA [Bacteroidaceae bacterium]
MMNYDLITILGPTASGKTDLAAHLAARLGDAEIISADSRQVYRGMDIGTGKDLADYTVDGVQIPYHLIDILDAGEKYNLFQYQQDFWAAYNDIVARGKTPILCGGTGLYIESVLRSYKMIPVPENTELRERLEGRSLEELTAILQTYKTLHNTTDVDTAKRAIRAIEIQEYYKVKNVQEQDFPQLKSLTIGVGIDRELRRQKISNRLQKRLDEGMVDEIRTLLETVPAEDLIYYGLEYKFVTLYCIGQLSYEEMFSKLEIAIHQFAKRQMTWFRGMEERRGIPIHWIDAALPMEAKVNCCLSLLNP